MLLEGSGNIHYFFRAYKRLVSLDVHDNIGLYAKQPICLRNAFSAAAVRDSCHHRLVSGLFHTPQNILMVCGDSEIQTGFRYIPAYMNYQRFTTYFSKRFTRESGRAISGGNNDYCFHLLPGKTITIKILWYRPITKQLHRFPSTELPS